MKNEKRIHCVKGPNLLVLCKHYFASLYFWSKFDFRKLTNLVVIIFYRINSFEANEQFSKKNQSSLDV